MENTENEYIEEEHQLFRLDDLDDFEVADEDPDVRGWDVIGAGGDKLGRVDELIVDPELMKVRYLDVEMDEEINDDGERHLLMPIGTARLDEDEDKVLVMDFTRDMLRNSPVYTGQPITRDYEEEIRGALLIEEKVVNPEDQIIAEEGDTEETLELTEREKHSKFYEHPHFSDQKFYGPRRLKRGLAVENPKPFRKKQMDDEDKQDFTLPPKM